MSNKSDNSAMRFWLKVAFSALGMIALVFLILVAGPLISVGAVKPFASIWVRSILVGIIVAATIGIIAYKIYQRRKAIAALEEAVVEADPVESDGKILSERMADALEMLKKTSGSRRNALYELPWYLIIGPSGAGKTTALVNSGLKFPLSDGTGPQSVTGTGGTRYCDWWFTEDAVLIDTAGRYTLHDSEPEADHRSWNEFLDLLAKHRSRQPINGVIVAISVEDLLLLDPESVSEHANAIRRRLGELHSHLKIDFPVYAVFTKADLISGFMEYFGNLNETRRNMVWGATFKTDDKSRNMIGAVPNEFDALVARLNEEIADKLQEEPDPSARVGLYAFPTQFAMLKDRVVSFLDTIFEPTRYQSNAMLRGFYFTSGTQEGTAIDQAIGSIARAFGTQDVLRSAYSGLGKSFFLKNLLENVIFAEAGWVSTNIAAVRRATGYRIAGYTVLVAIAIAMMGVWWTSYSQNRQLVEDTSQFIDGYSASAAPLIDEAVINDTNLVRALGVLNEIRYMPAGYANRDVGTPIMERFGLSQRPRLESANISAYRNALERTFRPRLVLRLEQQINQPPNEAFLYEAVKVYMMLVGSASTLQPGREDLIVSWMQRDWEELYPGGGNADFREELSKHLRAILELQRVHEPQITSNDVLISDAQGTLARMHVADRAYELLKSQARSSGIRDWVAVEKLGNDAALVFEGADGQNLDEVKVANFFTYAGFHNLFLDKLEGIAEQVENERWVLGDAGQANTVDEQYETLIPELFELYSDGFKEAWFEMLGSLRLRPLTADKPKYTALNAASSRTSPIRELLEAVRDETALTEERELPEEDTNNENLERVAGKGLQRVASKAGRAGRIGSRLAKAQLRAGEDGTVQMPDQKIESEFKEYHIWVDGEVGQRHVDRLLDNLSAIYSSLVRATEPSEAALATEALKGQVDAFERNATTLPDPLDNMMRLAAREFESDATGTAIDQLRQALAEKVTQVCERIVGNKYPVNRRSPDEIPIQEFSTVFAHGGVIDDFFNRYLDPLADTSSEKWQWREEDRMARELSPTTLANFQRAARIRDAFFPGRANIPSLTLQIEPLPLGGTAEMAELDVNGQLILSRQDNYSPKNIQWPSGFGNQRAAITITPKRRRFGLFGGGQQRNQPDQNSKLEKFGPWALYRLLESGRVAPDTNGVTARFRVGNNNVSYRITAGSSVNPFTLTDLNEFECPSGL